MAKRNYDVTTAAGQMRLMDESMGREHVPARVIRRGPGDYGYDPLGNGLFRMVPSGDIVDLAEMKRRRGL